MPDTDLSSAWREICARAWSDDAFKDHLIDRPHEVLSEAGFPLPEGLNYRVVEAGQNQVVLVLPRNPDSLEGASTAGDDAVSQYYASCL